MKQNGLGLEQISQKSGVELAVLKQLPIEETIGTQIDALAEQGKGSFENSLDERACTLVSPDDCNNYSRSPHTMTEETKQPLKLRLKRTLPKPQPLTSTTTQTSCKG
jgi:hypothetical protein